MKTQCMRENDGLYIEEPKCIKLVSDSQANVLWQIVANFTATGAIVSYVMYLLYYSNELTGELIIC